MKVVEINGKWYVQKGRKKPVYFAFYVDSRPSWTNRTFLALAHVSESDAHETFVEIEREP